VVVHNLNSLRPIIRPPKTDSVLTVNPDAVLPSTISLQQLEPIARRRSKKVEGLGGV